MHSSSRLYGFSVLFTFMLTGVGIGLLGAALPAMLAEWHLSDLRGGTLLLCAMGGSTAGPLFSRGHLRRTLVGAVALAAFALFLLAFTPPGFAFAIFALYGLALGVTMTSTSVLQARETDPTRRQQKLNLLNMLWAFGAAVSPWLTTHALRSLRVSSLFSTVGALFGLAALALLFTADGSMPPVMHAIRVRDTLARIPLPLAAIAALVVGVESSLGGWLTTYAQRTAHITTLSVSATSMFWMGLLLSRALAATSWLRRVALLRVALVDVAAAFIALVLLILAPTPMLLPAALLAGLGVGPLYPYVLSLVLGRFPGNTIFLIAGAGAALYPWLTGYLSNATHSLRVGLFVPAAGALALLMLLPFGTGIAESRPANLVQDTSSSGEPDLQCIE